MSKESMKMNRRDFLGLGAVAAVGAMGLAGCAPQTSAEKDLSATGDAAATPEATAVAEDWLGAEPEIAESDIVETLDTDFLIIGAGTAGLAAAGAAADLGLNFIACDKSNQNPETREYLGGVDTAYAKANNVTIDRPKLLNELTRYASGKCNQKLIKRWIDDSAEYIDWVTEVMKDAGKEGAHAGHAARARHGRYRLLCALCAAPVGALLRPAHAQRRHRRALVRPRSRHSVRA